MVQGRRRVGKWLLSTETSRHDGSKIVSLTLLAETETKTGHRPKLFLVCRDVGLQAYIVTGRQVRLERSEPNGTGYAMATIRLDRDEQDQGEQFQEEMMVSKDRTAMRFESPISFSKSLLTKKWMDFDFLPSDEITWTTTTFDVSGNEDAIGLVRRACKWWRSRGPLTAPR